MEGAVNSSGEVLAGEAQRVRITIEATLNGRYVRPDLESGEVADQVDRIIRETVVCGLLTTYLDGSGEAIWLDGKAILAGEHFEWVFIREEDD